MVSQSIVLSSLHSFLSYTSWGHRGIIGYLCLIIYKGLLLSEGADLALLTISRQGGSVILTLCISAAIPIITSLGQRLAWNWYLRLSRAVSKHFCYLQFRNTFPARHLFLCRFGNGIQHRPIMAAQFNERPRTYG